MQAVFFFLQQLKAGVGRKNISQRTLLHLSFYYLISLRQVPHKSWWMVITNFILYYTKITKSY